MGQNNHGDLNPRTIDERHRKFSNETAGLASVRDGAIKSNSTIKDSLKSKGPYIAEVLKVFTSAADQKATNAAHGGNMWGSMESKPDDIVTIVARIPELHHLCVPDNLPLESASDTYKRDAKIVDMYPRFVADRPGLSVPKVGQKVWVDFEDEVNYHGGLYLGVVDPNEVVVPTFTASRADKAAAKKAHETAATPKAKKNAAAKPKPKPQPAPSHHAGPQTKTPSANSYRACSRWRVSQDCNCLEQRVGEYRTNGPDLDWGN